MICSLYSPRLGVSAFTPPLLFLASWRSSPASEPVRRMNPFYEHQLHLTRRALFGTAARGRGALALASLVTPSLLGAAAPTAASGSKTEKWPGVITPPHYRPRIKRVVYL